MRRRCPIRLAVAAAALLGGTAACTSATKVSIGTQKEGQSCKQVSDCKAGLDCVKNVCKPLPPLTTGPQPGDSCQSDTDCAPDLFCGRQGVCTTSAPLDKGAACGLTVSCKAPLICNGQSGTCADDDGSPGSYDKGGSCSDILDCRRPYLCGLDHSCTEIPLYLGPNCSRSDNEAGAFRVYFELPPAPGDSIPDDFEFYRLPFPNDLRVVDGAVNLAGHPSPGAVLGIDVPGEYFKDVHEDVHGFAVNQPVFFRFSDVVDPGTVCLDANSIYPGDGSPTTYCTGGGDASVYLVNIDPQSAHYGEHVPVQMAMNAQHGQYICQNWLGIAPKDGEPLDESTTYAAVITTAVHDAAGDVPIQDRDFAAIMNRTAAAGAMQPLLDWVAGENIDATTIAGATVFTTGQPDAVAAKIRQAVQAETPAPTFDSNTVVCGVDTTPSPCNDGLPTDDPNYRGCDGAHTGFYEVQGTYQAAAFQAGTRPYNTPDQGGAFVYDTSGVPIPQGTESMCFAAAIPMGTPPAGGYPVVIYGHGTGGNYRSFIGNNIAAWLTSIGYAVVGFDNVMHGPRQQPLGTTPDPSTWKDPGRLFFNLVNPRASRDNILQGAADLFHLVRLTRNAATTLSTPDGSVHFDPNAVYYLGHSQGTVISPPFLAAEPNLQAAVLSGAGAELALSILHKKKPTDLGQLAGAFFGDQNISRIHPMMGILAMLFAPADAISYAADWVHDPAIRGTPLPLMQFTGLDDSYAPDIAQYAQIRAAGLPLVGTVYAPIDGVSQQASPQQDNVTDVNGTAVTAGAVQYPPGTLPDGSTDDGHYVMFDEGQGALQHFFQTAASGTPEIQH